MAAKKRRKPGLIWRVLFGHNGPTKAELRKLWRQSFTNTFTLNVRDPATGRVQKKQVRIDDDGRIQEVKAPAKKKRPAAKEPSGKRTASQPSKPSRASKTGSTQRRQQPTTAAAPRRRRAEPLADRVLRNPDGTLNGSRPANPAAQLRKAEQAYLKASQRAEHLLGWENPPR